MTISVVILAAGKSSRMGSVKQLLPFNNSTFLQAAINHALKSKAENVYVVLGANSEIIRKKISDDYVSIVQNINWHEGLSSSIISIINHLENLKEEPDALLIMLADQPKVDSNYINQLIALFQDNQQAIIASTYREVNGVPAIFPRKYFKMLSNLKGDKGAKKLLNERLADVISYKPKSAEILIDIDFPEDYKNLIKKTL